MKNIAKNQKNYNKFHWVLIGTKQQGKWKNFNINSDGKNAILQKLSKFKNYKQFRQNLVRKFC